MLAPLNPLVAPRLGLTRQATKHSMPFPASHFGFLGAFRKWKPSMIQKPSPGIRSCAPGYVFARTCQQWAMCATNPSAPHLTTLMTTVRGPKRVTVTWGPSSSSEAGTGLSCLRLRRGGVGDGDGHFSFFTFFVLRFSIFFSFLSFFSSFLSFFSVRFTSGALGFATGGLASGGSTALLVRLCKCEPRSFAFCADCCASPQETPPRKKRCQVKHVRLFERCSSLSAPWVGIWRQQNLHAFIGGIFMKRSWAQEHAGSHSLHTETNSNRLSTPVDPTKIIRASVRCKASKVRNGGKRRSWTRPFTTSKK